MKVFIGSVIVVLIAAIITWFISSIFFKPVGSVIKRRAQKFKKNMEESDVDGNE